MALLLLSVIFHCSEIFLHPFHLLYLNLYKCLVLLEVLFKNPDLKMSYLRRLGGLGNNNFITGINRRAVSEKLPNQTTYQLL